MENTSISSFITKKFDGQHIIQPIVHHTMPRQLCTIYNISETKKIRIIITTEEYLLLHSVYIIVDSPDDIQYMYLAIIMTTQGQVYT